MDDKVMMAVDHLKTHVTYPATTEEVLAACESWSDVDQKLVDEGKMKLEAMKGKTWNSAEEVLAVLGWPADGSMADGSAMGGAM